MGMDHGTALNDCKLALNRPIQPLQGFIQDLQALVYFGGPDR